VLADIDPDTATLDPASVERCLNPRTRAILVVHLYGQAGALDVLNELAENRGVHLIEDCAQAHGARFDGRPVGSIGTLGAWSFYPTKNLGTAGDGGAITTNSEALDEVARALRNYGQTHRYHHPFLGLNSRLDEVQAAMLQVRLRQLPAWTERRRVIASAYAGGIRNSKVRILPLSAENERHVHHLFVVTTESRDALMEHLRALGIGSLIHYPVPAHHQPPFRDLLRDPQGLSSAEQHADRCVSLPCHPAMTDADVTQVIEAVNSFA
jgi:dTDP-4-amino-4,6-dideoxygalactose transaminase